MEFQGKKDHHCTFCDFKCNTKSKLEQHVRKHTREKPFLCDRCNRRFSIKPNLRLHVRHVHQGIKRVYEKKYKCSLCPYATYNRTVIKKHKQRHTAERSFACQMPNCEYAAKSAGELELHITGKHSDERRYLCQFPNCGYRGKTPMVLRQHYMKHSESKPFACDVPECNFRAKMKKGLEQHKIGVHNRGYKPFACSSCSHRTTTKSKLQIHEFTHSKEKPFKCSFTGCVYQSKTKKLLNEHVQNLHREKTYKCDFEGCLSNASSRSRLELHKKLVHSEKVYQCPHCEYRTAVPSVLQKHIVCHNNDTLPCLIKGCTFKSKSLEYLNKHMKYHKANLDCLAEGCSYVATSRLALKRHLKIHDPTARRFHCFLCNKHYRSNSGLQAHLKSHTQEKPFQCPACNYGAVRKKHITAHVRAMHSNVFTEFVCDDEFICGHCFVNFGSAIGLAIHTIKTKTAVIMLTRLKLKFDC